MIESRLGRLVDKEEVKRLNEQAEWYAFKRDGTMVTGKLRELRNEAGKQPEHHEPGPNSKLGHVIDIPNLPRFYDPKQHEGSGVQSELVFVPRDIESRST